MPDAAAKLLFQVIAGRAEKSSHDRDNELTVLRMDNEFPNTRLCKAMLDRLTDQAHFIDTGDESYRFRRRIEGSAAGDETCLLIA